MERLLAFALVVGGCTPAAEAPPASPPPVVIEANRPANDAGGADVEPAVVVAPAVEGRAAPIAAEPAPAPSAPSCSGAAGAYTPAGNSLLLRGTPPQLVLPGPILFKVGSGDLQPASGVLVNLVAGHMKANPRVTMLRIEVHSDSQGSEASNLKLSKVRAFSLACALRSAGIHCTRLVPVGFGESKPIASNQTAAGRAQNRRSEFYHAAIDNALVGGIPIDGGGEIAGDPCQ